MPAPITHSNKKINIKIFIAFINLGCLEENLPSFLFDFLSLPFLFFSGILLVVPLVDVLLFLLFFAFFILYFLVFSFLLLLLLLLGIRLPPCQFVQISFCKNFLFTHLYLMISSRSVKSISTLYYIL